MSCCWQGAVAPDPLEPFPSSSAEGRLKSFICFSACNRHQGTMAVLPFFGPTSPSSKAIGVLGEVEFEAPSHQLSWKFTCSNIALILSFSPGVPFRNARARFWVLAFKSLRCARHILITSSHQSQKSPTLRFDDVLTPFSLHKFWTASRTFRLCSTVFGCHLQQPGQQRLHFGKVLYGCSSFPSNIVRRSNELGKVGSPWIFHVVLQASLDVWNAQPWWCLGPGFLEGLDDQTFLFLVALVLWRDTFSNCLLLWWILLRHSSSKEPKHHRPSYSSESTTAVRMDGSSWSFK